MKILDDRFMDGNGGKYKPSLVRVGSGCSPSVSNVTLDNKVNQITAIGSKPKELEDSIVALRKDLKRTQIEIGNLQRRIQLVANASTYLLSRDWEIRIDEQNFKSRKRVLFVNHKLKKVELNCPPRPKEGTELYPISEMPHYRSFMASLVKYIERHNENHSKLMQLTLVQNAAVSLETSNYNKVGTDLNRELETHVLNSTHIVMTTLGSAGSRAMEDVAKFSVIVIDEAAQSSEPATLPALKLGSSHCVLVGDPQQLPATIFSMSGRETKFDRSLFQRLEEGGHQVNMLNTQYRMNPKISAFPRQIFYDGSLLDGPNVKKPNYGGELTQMVKSKFRHFKPLTVLDLDSTEEREGTNLSNGDEARLALHLFCSLDHETNGMSKKSKVAIITPYMQQVILIKRLFEGKYGLSYNKMVDISTIDAFQGKEANIVILSCVRGASRSVGIGFLSDVQRMNVALTRAKHFLFVIARCRTILINPFWRDFVAHARKERAILRIIPRRNTQHGGKNYGRRNNGASASIEQMFPDLRHVGPIHQEERGAGIPGINPNQQYNQFQGGISHSQRYNQFQGGGDGNISA
jgi:senataxin